MAKPKSADSLLKNMRQNNSFIQATAPAESVIIPNHSGDHSRGKVNTTPTSDFQIPNKKYIDDLDNTASGKRDVLSDNIMLNAFRIAINGSLTQFNMVDGVVDEFEDESGVDTGSSTNENYNSTDDFYESVAALDLGDGLVFHAKCNDDAASTAVDESSDTNQDGVSDNNTSDMSATGKISKALDFESANTDKVDFGDNSAWDGETDMSWAFWVNPDDLSAHKRAWSKWQGSANRCWAFGQVGSNRRFSIGVSDNGAGSGTQTIQTSTNSFTNGTWTHVTVVLDGGTSLTVYINGSADTPGSTSGSVPDSVFAGTSEVWMGQYDGLSGYDFDGLLDDCRIYNKVLSAAEIAGIYNSGDGTESATTTGGDMTLFSNATTAEAAPSNARLQILEENVDSVTINTDLKAYVSRDGGTTYTQVTLIDEGNFDANKQILAANIDLSSQPTGTSMKYKITTHNSKKLKLHAVGLTWA